jgi:dTDP-4-amino-4,6-dideoxygalactose transaminase
MISLFKVKMSDDVMDRIAPTINSGFITQGPRVEEFEDRLQAELGSKCRPITVNSATSALSLAMDLCDIQPGDEVISTPQTCFATQVGLLHKKAIIRWADIDPKSGLIDPASVRDLITDKTKAIVAVNWAGKIADYAVLKSFGVPVIEDAAHCWDTFFADKVERGDYTIYSFQAIKFLTTGDGGILLCPEEKQHEARLKRWFGLDRTKNESFRINQNIQYAGYKYHMNDIAAAIGLANLDSAKASVVAHRKNAKKYCDAFKDLSFASVLPFDDNCSYWIFSMIMNEDRDKEEFASYLKSNGIESSDVHFRNDQFDITKQFYEKELPGLDSFSKNQINIPVGWWLSESEVEYIIEKVTEYK